MAIFTGTQALIIGASLSGAAAAAHLACIFIGAPAYRFMGAGEPLARAAEAKRLRPIFITMAIGGVLLLWSAYALSGAGVIGVLPQTRLALTLICAVYFGRAIAFPLLRLAFPENSNTFWWVSSCMCAFIGFIHIYGTVILWRQL